MDCTNETDSFAILAATLQEKVEELQYVVQKQQEEMKEAIVRWSNIAYDLADALCEEMIEGSDGPPKPVCYAPCDCLSHKALDQWGQAQVALLNELNPNWEEEMYNGML